MGQQIINLGYKILIINITVYHYTLKNDVYQPCNCKWFVINNNFFVYTMIKEPGAKTKSIYMWI